MITTKRSSEEGVRVSVNSNNMFNAGHLVLPERQSSYSSGTGSKYDDYDYVWGDKLDVGRTAMLYDPVTYEKREQLLTSKGKDNYSNIHVPGILSNNNISVSSKGKNGSIRNSLTYNYHHGQYLNQKMNNFMYTVGGNIKAGNFTLDASASFHKRFYPQNLGGGSYGSWNYLYNFIVWTGAEFDVRDYRNYWKEGKEQQEQNWWTPRYYDNPYFTAYERTTSRDENRYNAQVNASYQIAPWLKATARAGADVAQARQEERTPYDTRRNDSKFALQMDNGFSINADAMLVADKKIGDFNIDGLLGASIFYYRYDRFSGETSGGLSMPGYYSLSASKSPVSTSTEFNKKEDQSVYGKIGLSWKNALFLDVTGRNDWASTLSASERSFFYPSAAGSIVLTEFLPEIKWLNFWKIRGSWTVTKTAPWVYTINQTYGSNSNVWNNLIGSSYPDVIRSSNIKPQTRREWEIGTAAWMLDNRLKLDVAYYQRLYYNNQSEAGISRTSGFRAALVNNDEQWIRKGAEVTLSGDIIRTRDFRWNATVNWATWKYTYAQLDDVYSSKEPWVGVGKEINTLEVMRWERSPSGELIHDNGKPLSLGYWSRPPTDPDWFWGFGHSLNYKQFSLNFSFDGRVGGYFFNRISQAMWMAGAHPGSDNQWRYDEVMNGAKNYVGQGVKVVGGAVEYDTFGNITSDTRVFAPNDVEISYEQYIRAYNDPNSRPREQNVNSQTFFKLRELSIGYQLPRQLSQKVKAENIQISFTGQNLLLWTKDAEYYDPDDFDYNRLPSASMRLVGFNVKVDF
jgi:hypothetical protein